MQVEDRIAKEVLPRRPLGAGIHQETEIYGHGREQTRSERPEAAVRCGIDRQTDRRSQGKTKQLPES